MYSESLSRVINSLLRVNPRERPTAAQVLSMPEIQDKILSFQALQRARPEPDNLLLNTIKVPQALRKLNDVLPKPCYPEPIISPRAPPPVPPPSSNESESLKEAAVGVVSEVSPRAVPHSRNPHPPQRAQPHHAPHRVQFSNYAR